MISSITYIERFKFSEIVRISSKWHEESHGFENEHTTEVIACKHNGEYYRMKIHLFAKTMGGEEYTILEKEGISKEEHQGYTSEFGGILDTSESRTAIKEMSEIIHQIKGVYPNCPKCHSEMTTRSGSYGKFFGCSRYPDCDGTVKYDPNYEVKVKELTQKKEEIQKRIKH